MGSPINSNPKLSGFAYICQKLSDFGNWLGRGIRWIKNKCCCCCVKRVDDAANKAINAVPMSSTKLSSVPPSTSNPTGSPAVSQAERKEAAAAEITEAQIAAGTSLQINGITITVKGFADPFNEQVDVIVNAANVKFSSEGRGANEAIKKIAGERPFTEAQAQLKAMYEKDNNVAYSATLAKPGIAVLTSAGSMENARFLIQALAPDLRNADMIGYKYTDEVMATASKQLKAAYSNSLMHVRQKNEELRQEGQPLIKSILFPSLGTGNYRFPVNDAALIAMQVFKEFAEQYLDSGLTSITLSIYAGPRPGNPKSDYEAYSTVLEKMRKAQLERQAEIEEKLKASGSTTIGEISLVTGNDRQSERRETLIADHDGSTIQMSGNQTAQGSSNIPV